jgi:hypothetical protein
VSHSLLVIPLDNRRNSDIAKVTICTLDRSEWIMGEVVMIHRLSMDQHTVAWESPLLQQDTEMIHQPEIMDIELQL